MRFIGALPFIMAFVFAAGGTVSISIDRNANAPSHGKVVMCSVLTETVLKERKIPFKLDNADLNLCTHVVSSDSASHDNIAPWSENSKVVANDYQKLTKLRKIFPHLKILLGIQLKTAEYMLSANYPEDHQQFLLLSHNFVVQHRLDGINLQIRDLEESKNSQQDFEKIVVFLRALKEKFDRSNLLLTVSIPVSKSFLETNYNFKSLSKTVDFISFIQTFKNEHSDEHTISEAESVRNTLILGENIERLIGSGVKAEKIVIGLNLEGSQFITSSVDGVESSKFDKPIGYYEVCNLLSGEEASNWKRSFLDKSDVAILTKQNDNQAIVFDSSRSLANKVRFAIRHGMAGVITSPINQDDFLGRCTEDKETFIDFKPVHGVKLNIPRRKAVTFPLLRTIHESIHVTLDEIRQEETLEPIASATTDQKPAESNKESKDKETKDEPEASASEQEQKPIQLNAESTESNSEAVAAVASNTTSTSTQGNVPGVPGVPGGASYFTYNSFCLISVIIVAFITSKSL